MTKSQEESILMKDLNNKDKPSRSYGATSNQIESPHTPSVYRLSGRNLYDDYEDHCHRVRFQGVDKHARKKLIIASILCLVFMLAEIVGGVLSNSLAIATDAAHLLTDFASFMISLFAISLAARPSTQRMSFGWHRAEIIGALISVSMIWVITGILVWLAVQRLISGEYEVEATIMLITSGLGILANLIMGCQLYQSGHGHSHGGLSRGEDIFHTEEPARHKKISKSDKNEEINKNGDLRRGVDTTENYVAFNLDSNNENEQTAKNETNLPQNQAPKSKSVGHGHEHGPGENLNIRAAFIHVVGDVLQSLGVFIAAIIIFFQPTWGVVDPICTFLFSIIILFTTWGIIKDALLVLMEATPSNLHYAEVMNTFQKIEGVEHVHNLRIWALSLNKVSLAVHLAIAPGIDAKKVLKEASTAVHMKYNFFETTIQIEDATADMANCEQCEPPLE